MKNIKIAFLGISLSFIMCVKDSFGQKGLELTLKYNLELDKFEVYAKPNFSQRNFLLGPSQVTVILPSMVVDEKLRIQNSDGGVWEDNTSIFSPAINPTSDYHGITTLGAKTDFIEGVETLLFSFSLAQSINSSDIKLFDNEKDPKSSAAGMRGGDFSNTINNAFAEEYYIRNYKEPKKASTSKEENKKKLQELDDTNLLVYPNTTKDEFKIVLNGVNDDDDISLIVTSEIGKELIHVNATKKNLEEKTFRIPSEISSQNLVVRVKFGSKFFSKKLIINRE